MSFIHLNSYNLFFISYKIDFDLIFLNVDQQLISSCFLVFLTSCIQKRALYAYLDKKMILYKKIQVHFYINSYFLI